MNHRTKSNLSAFRSKGLASSSDPPGAVSRRILPQLMPREDDVGIGHSLSNTASMHHHVMHLSSSSVGARAVSRIFHTTAGASARAGLLNMVARLRLASILSLLALAVLGPGPVRAGAAESTSDQLAFNNPSGYDDGAQTSVALHSSNLVLEFHQGTFSRTFYYRLGLANANGVSWGPTRETGFSGNWPTVAISEEGYVIVVGSLTSTRNKNELYYRVGWIDPYGGKDQFINWLTGAIHWDGGFHTSIAMNDAGIIVGVHESNNISNNNLHYRVGRLRNPAAGDYTIQWDSGHAGIRYDSGKNPHIAINNHNQVVEVHQSAQGNLLHYRRGTVHFSDSSATIAFGESQRYNSFAQQPAVALLDSGRVLELHVHEKSYELYSRVGQLSASDPAIIHWSLDRSIVDQDYPTVGYPALAANGTFAVETHEGGNNVIFHSPVHLRYSVANVSE
jgi:hypothetical protein